VSEFKFDKLNEQQMQALADAHCRMYENRIRQGESGFRGIRVDECKTLLGIWKSISTKLGQGNWRIRLTKPEINEIQDALAAGDYDKLLQTTTDAPS
jgi:hypothetical protein